MIAIEVILITLKDNKNKDMTTTHGKIGRWHGAGLLATTLLGTSVFILPQMTVDIAGSTALWAWALLTVAILPVALVFAKLSAQFPHAAGPAFFVEKAFGLTAGRTIGMIFLFVVPLGAPAALIMTYQFVDAIFQLSEQGAIWVQLSFIVLLFILNFRGLQVSASLQLGLTFFITLVVAAMFTGLGFDSTASASLEQISTSADSSLILAASGLAFWSFLGIEAMSHLSGDFKHPKKDLVPAIMIGTVLVGLIYLICTYLVLAVPSNTELHMVGAFDQLFGQGGQVIIGCLGIAGGLATVNVYTASLTRLMWSFANDGVLPKVLAYQNSNGVAVKALTLLLTVNALVLVITHFTGIDLEQLLNWVNGVFAVIYFASMLAAFKLLKRKYLPVTVMSCGFCLLMFWGLGINMAYALLLMALITPFLYLQKKRKQHIQTVS